MKVQVPNACDVDKKTGREGRSDVRLRRTNAKTKKKDYTRRIYIIKDTRIKSYRELKNLNLIDKNGTLQPIKN